METSLIISCGATLADILRDYPPHQQPRFEKLHYADPRGSYGEYVLWTDTSTAETILRRYPKVARCA